MRTDQAAALDPEHRGGAQVGLGHPPVLVDGHVADRRQVEQLGKLRQSRDNGRVRATLEALSDAAAGNSVNMMPYILDCVRAYTTLGEICDALRSVYGVYEEPQF